MPEIEALSEERRLRDLDATLDCFFAFGCGPDQVGIIDFCTGSVAFRPPLVALLERTSPFAAAVSEKAVFGMPALLELAPEFKTPWLGLFGDRDQGIPSADVELLRIGAAQPELRTEIIRCVEAEHGFHCNARPSYHSPSALDAWDRTLRWFETHLSVARTP